ncbi:hypothetical protein [Wolbachia endosymbiont of Tettigetta isshikii]|uniref:hypothetical protein n=1 Tax=Wolbachia endosymbiont of Tettigetta isshikii TaxID=3239093 RepID=UPI0039815D7C
MVPECDDIIEYEKKYHHKEELWDCTLLPTVHFISHIDNHYLLISSMLVIEDR